MASNVSSGERQPLLTKPTDFSYSKEGYDSSINSEKQTSEVKLEKHIGLASAVAIILGNVLGSGIFLTPNGVVKNLGSVGLTLIVWGLTGIYSLAQALCYAELGTVIPKAGGDYAYIYQILGPLPGYLCLWCHVFAIAPSADGAVAQTAGLYLAHALGMDCHTSLMIMMAVFFVVCCVVLNCVSVRWSVRMQNITAIGKVLAFAIIIIPGIIYLAQGKTENFKDPFAGTITDPGQITIAILNGYFAYSGWELVNTLPEEMVNPTRDLPRAVWIGMLLVTFVNVLTNVAYFVVLTPAEIASTNAVALLFGERTIGPAASWVICLCVIMSCLGAVNGSILSDSRYLVAGGRTRQMPRVFSMINVDYLTPTIAVGVFGCLAVTYTTIPFVNQLVQYTSLVAQLKVLLAMIALFHLRWTQPDIHRPVKVNILIAALVFILLLVIIGLSVYSDPVTTGIGLALFFLGIPVHFIIQAGSKSNTLGKFMDSLTITLQRLFRVVEVPENEVDKTE